MKTNLITISLVIIGLSVFSCRQSEEMLIDQEEQISVLDNQNAAKEDSTSTPNTFENNDPPKNGTHWKIKDDSIKTPTKSFENLKSDSLIYSVSINENDPPKNGTHWKGN
ncbi:hypothetical protein [Chryseobacterium terrae]|uniref:Uncharacterized protein n=1 Tax=Chryseobacterium terrae TaxID=3163299 RepID=A0ABW8XXI6_9FLAO